MQDPTAFQPMKTQGFPEQEQLKCPRCDSTNTKFCYYNNYNLSQPRHFCKNCRRYWTKGGTLRNIPVGGGSRKNTKRSSTTTKRSSASTSPSPSPSSSSPSVPSSIADTDPTRVYGNPSSGTFSSLLASSAHMGNLFEGLNSNGSGLKMAHSGESSENYASSAQRVANSGSEMPSNNGDSERFLSLQNGGNGWSNLAMYTPGSSFR